MNTGLSAERAPGRELGFSASERAFVKFRLQQIPVDRLKIREAEFVCAIFRVADALFQHFNFSLGADQPAHAISMTAGLLL